MPELSVVLPTYNERENIPVVCKAIAYVLEGIDYEIIVVDDDSDDGTALLVRHLAQTNLRLRIIHRIHRRGLASACVEGMMASSAPFIAVMDADMQHDERILPAMLDLIKCDHLDLVVGSRHVSGGSMGAFARSRVALSEAGRYVGNLVTKVPVTDSMSGYFIVSRTYLDEVVRSLSCKGFKILLDLVASARRPVRIKEVPYSFRNRLLGESKLDVLTGLEYLELVIDKTIGRWIPTRYVFFVLVGTLGLLSHLLLVSALINGAGVQFGTAQTLSSTIIIAVNFFLNNLLTFRSVRLKGARMLRGLAIFYVACLVGLVANVELAGYLKSFNVPWYGASLVGLVVGSVWNFGISEVAIWRRKRSGSHLPLELAASAAAASQN